jgi:hypothetical protein
VTRVFSTLLDLFVLNEVNSALHNRSFTCLERNIVPIVSEKHLFLKNLLPIVGVPENYRENIFGSVTKKNVW